MRVRQRILRLPGAACRYMIRALACDDGAARRRFIKSVTRRTRECGAGSAQCCCYARHARHGCAAPRCYGALYRAARCQHTGYTR